MNITLQQMRTLDAVVTQGSIQAGAKSLNKTHPSVITALQNLEAEAGFALFDRSGYRLVLTAEGKTFHQGVQRILGELGQLNGQVAHLREREEAQLNIVVGDITPLASALAVLRKFREQHRFTRLNLFFGNLFGPNESLLDGAADLIIHHVDKSDSRYEYRDFCKVQIVPVAAPGFLDIPITKALRYTDLKDHTQCIIRDTAMHSEKLSRFIVADAPQLTVGDQYTKKEVILQGMAWGHMPLFMIEHELNSGRLASLVGKHIKGITREIVIARLSTTPKGAMAERLWQSF